MKQNLIEKLKSWPLWLSIASLLIFCVKHFCDLDISETVNQFMDLILPILVAFGIVNNPNDRKSF